MTGDAEVIDDLNRAIRSELTAVSQYALHDRLQEDPGHGHMARKCRAESIAEMHHTDMRIARAIFPEGHPNLQKLSRLPIGQTPRKTLERDLAAEIKAGALHKEARESCAQVGDYGTMTPFKTLLADKEGHRDFLETQIDLSDKLGAERHAQLNALPLDQAE